MKEDKPQEDRLDQLISELFDGDLSPTDRTELNALLEGAPRARERYWSSVELHAALHHEAEDFPQIERVEESGEVPNSATKKRKRPLLWACGIGLAVALITAVLFLFSDQEDRDEGTFATVQVIDGARWDEGSEDLTQGRRLGTNDVRIASGKAEIQFASGALVTLHGPAQLTLTDAARCRLLSGVAQVYAPGSAKGFIVDTPWTKVVDLGTHFSVLVDEGMGIVQTQVLEGMVSVSHGDSPPVEVVAGASITASSERLGTIPVVGLNLLAPPVPEGTASVEGFGRQGTVSYEGEVIATWEMTVDRLEGFGMVPLVVISTRPHGKFVGVDIDADRDRGGEAHDQWEFTLKITPVPGAPAELASIQLLGFNPNFSCRLLGPTRQGVTGAADKLSFTGVGMLPGQLSDPTSPDAPRGNLSGEDGETVPLDGTSSLSWLRGDLFGHDWSKHTNWQISFPVIQTREVEALELTYSADFAGNVWSEGFGFSFTVR